MARKVIIVGDPGIDGAFAVALALRDPELDLIGVAATSGNVTAEQATRNVQILIEQLDPPRWPRLGAALPVEYTLDAVKLHGAGGLGGVDFPCAQLHHPHPSDKLISDLVHLHPKEITVVLMGPATVFARALDRDSEVASLVERILFVGGAWHEPGDASATAEFHFFCDPAAARQVLRCGAPITLLPLDVTRKLLFAPTELLQLPASESRTTSFLRQIVPQGIAGTASLFGVEGFHLQDVLGLVPLVLPSALTTRSLSADVEQRGELTRGMSVFDARWGSSGKANVELATGVDVPAVRQYIHRTLNAE
ncbi:MAG TPA: nucleoside hydrolase [Gemmataceae bacterium]|jgi:inosine-uridine nucleoside N-ribohydrolase